MDRRVEKTRTAIIEALTKLMSKKEYQSITVADIIKKANVGRSTFYENFLNKDEVFDEILDTLIYHVFDEIEHNDGHAFQNNLKGEITHMYIHIRENEGKAKTFLLGKSADIFYKRMGEKVARICDEKLKASSSLPPELTHSHIASTFSDILKYWSGNKFSDSPEQVAEYFMYLAGESVV
ncbi:MAG: TetR/AcrR family transcriptional regulator [Treponema sp.]|uniref:TetR/AcrR family transcriptional regulator n=1 Tax=Treponema sp. TaxID=166 RepID=UPI0025FAD510|nr:TetR/AcrR family transcriptional regulator [Treponema sp.]MBQ8679509.1 TetR/AcrR family transcriptional regulator [Treponema sp.]MBR1638003.1 TetR/AcrR family transcriptional regulator [Treponema sp.]